MKEHKAILAKLPKRMQMRSAEIDVKMEPLIQELWRRGWTTRACCQGRERDQPNDRNYADYHRIDKAYIAFGTALEAALFVALAGPSSWPYRTRWRQQDKSKARNAPDWVTWWDLELDRGANVVQFPNADIEPATIAIRKAPPLASLIGTLSVDRIGAATTLTHPLPSAPVRICPTCEGPVMSRRKDARYCSRKCQLAARDRRGKE